MRRVLMVLVVLLPVVVCAQAKPKAVEIKNPGFEDELRGWDNADNPELAGVFTLDHDNKRAGKAALHMHPAMGGQWPWVSQKVEQIDGGALYAARMWFRGAEQSDSMVALKIEYLNAKGEVVGGRYARRPLPNGVWTQMMVEALAPDEVASAVLYVRLIGETEAWFDDVEMVRATEPPAVTVRPLRLALAPGAPKQVHLEIVSRAELPEQTATKLALSDSTGKEVGGVKGEFTRQDAHVLAGDFELPGLTSGTHAWRVKLPQGQAEGRLYVALAKRQPKTLTDQGFLKVGLTTVFPIGLYHVGVADYGTIAEQGFNAAQGLASQDPKVLRQALVEAQRVKVMLDIPLHYGGLVAGNFVASQQKLQYFAKDQGISGWKLADEPDQHPEYMDEVPEAYQRLKQKEELRPLLLTVERPDTYEFWANFCDALQVVCFPVPGQPLTMVAERVAAARKVMQPWQHLSVLLQAGWLPNAGNQPTFEQARVMVYLAVLNGAEGIYWYSLRDPGWQLADSPLWEKFKELNAETARLGQFATGARKLEVTGDNPKLQAAAWSVGDGVQLAVCNPQAEAQTAVLKLPQAAATVTVTNGTADIEIKDGALTVKMGPTQAALVTVEVVK